jgi:adenylylsulfate kinase-like enzyme
MARDMFDEYEFIEIFVDVPLDVAMQRDPGTYFPRIWWC